MVKGHNQGTCYMNQNIFDSVTRVTNRVENYLK